MSEEEEDGEDSPEEGGEEEEDTGQTPAKLRRKDLYKPPTNDELNQLRETESLFHSSLFRLQVSCSTSINDVRE